MSYIIAVLAMVVIGVGFTLLQGTDQPAEQPNTDDLIALSRPEELSAETPPVTTATNDMSVSSGEDDWEEEDEDDEWEDEDDDYKPVSSQPSPTPVPTPVSAPTPAPAPAPTPATATDYKNGTYVARTTYKTPDRDTYTMDVSVTIANDKVTATDIVFDNRALRDSYVKRFDSSYGSLVVGKDLGSLSLSRVAGASLTTNAFNKALADIKTQAGA